MGYPLEAPGLKHLAAIVVSLYRQFSPAWAGMFSCSGDSRSRLFIAWGKSFGELLTFQSFSTIPEKIPHHNPHHDVDPLWILLALLGTSKNPESSQLLNPGYW